MRRGIGVDEGTGEGEEAMREAGGKWEEKKEEKTV